MSAINDGSGCFIIFSSRVDGEGSILEGWYMCTSQAFVFFIYKKVALALIFMFVLCGVITDTTGRATDAQTFMLNVFDGIHLFSAGYWGLLHNNMQSVDQGFSSKVATYNRAHHTQKIWAAGVEPGYNDTRVPGRRFTYIVPRNNGATYRISWQAAIASHPTWITITSFNEWFEGAMIESGVHYGDQYLRLTAQLASQWRQ
jgi:hypothetical protein